MSALEKFFPPVFDSQGRDTQSARHGAGSAPEPADTDWESAAAESGGVPAIALDLARRAGAGLALPGSGDTAGRWRVLTALSAGDLTCGRIAEAHLDALAILAEAGPAAPWTQDLTSVPPGARAPAALGTINVDNRSTWGVFAAEGGGTRLAAVPDGDGGWQLTGVKPWCSLAGLLSHALVTAHVEGGRRLFAVALRAEGVGLIDQPWVSRGLAGVPSGPVSFDQVMAVPIGETDWYLRRPGFAWGGIGVAACWFGGVLALARTLHTWARSKEPDQIGAMHLGAADIAAYRCAAVLQDAAAAVDAGRASGVLGVALAVRVRTVIAQATEELIERCGHAMGPAPLAQQEAHARRIADLGIYVRQHHAERDLAVHGAALAADATAPW